MVHCTPPRGGRGRRPAVDILRGVFGGIPFFFSFSLLRTHTAYCKYEATLPRVPLYWYRGAYRGPLFKWSVCPSVCVCVTFVVFTDCESCTWPISTSSGLMKSSEYGLIRGTCVFACRFEVVAVDGADVGFVVCFPWGGIFCAFYEFAFSNSSTQQSASNR